VVVHSPKKVKKRGVLPFLYLPYSTRELLCFLKCFRFHKNAITESEPLTEMLGLLEVTAGTQCECSSTQCQYITLASPFQASRAQNNIHGAPVKMASGVQWDAYDSDDILNPNSCYRKVPYQKATTTKKPSVFNYYIKIQTPEFKKNNTEFTNTEVYTQLLAMWKALTDAEKTKYAFNLKKYRRFLSPIFYQVEDQNDCRHSLLALPSLE
jgi:hypothetical protein